ncbi:MAG: trigger factor [Anaerolineaceae bacterium]|nr:trigger factor [Anaerolineaceae bacterium]
MNIQTERLDNHTARLTVEIDAERFDSAKKEAARKIAKKVNIPGFRRGKAPYKILANYIGEAAIIEDAAEIIANQVYPEALDESGLNPYGPASFEDFSADPPKLIFVLPLEPEIDLGDYRVLRLDYTAPVVEDSDVESVFKELQEQHALIEESSKPVAMGNRLTVDIHAVLVDEDEAETESEAAPETVAEAAEAEADDTEEEHDDMDMDSHFHDDDKVLLHRHDSIIVLNDDHAEFAPGFNAALVGAAVGETREFELEFPDDAEKYENLAGEKGNFVVTIKKVETMTLPELTDDFAARVTAEEKGEDGEPKPLTLLELRMRIRENLEKNAKNQANDTYFSQALENLVEGAKIAYPEAMVKDQINTRLRYLDQELRRQGLTLEDYMRILNKSREDVEADNRDAAVRELEQGLVLRQIVQDEKITVPESAVDEEITAMVAQYGDQAEAMRSLFSTASMRDNLYSELTQRQAVERVIAIAKGEAPEITAEELPQSEDSGVADVENTPGEDVE